MNEDLIRTVIIDDEDHCRTTLSEMVKKYCPNLVNVGTASSVETGISIIESIKPELVFLDIHLEDGDGFEILQKISYKNFEIIFTTAHEEFALKAIEFSALHYLLKPISKKALVSAIERFGKSRNKEIQEEKINLLQESLLKSPDKIILPTNEGFQIIQLEAVVYCEASDKYAIFHMKDGTSNVISKSLNDVERTLQDLTFVRIHHSYMINLKYIKGYDKGKGGYVSLTNGKQLEISFRRKQLFIDKLKQFVTHF
ncbi:MAG: response regulator transcription factor [Bacteroidetes bacterium]|nr:response regulator transcription factor [Bacteroidota bacterium]MBL6964223.1 response regulator transcription factor [Bacteroidota bacterium]